MAISKPAFAPVQDEHTDEKLDVISGTLPADLDGIFVRNGPNPQFAPNGSYHWFDGDGMLHAVEFRKGAAPTYRNRYVQTARFKQEKAEGKKTFVRIADLLNPAAMVFILLSSIMKEIIHRFRNKGKPGPTVQLGTGTANTALEFHDRRLLALVESDLPTHVTVPDLATIGPYNYDGKLQHMFTAHPKVDAATGEMSFFGYDFRNSCLHYRVVGSDGSITPDLKIPLTVPVMMHDFACSANHAIFPVLPITFRMERLLRGEPVIQWDNDFPSKFGVMPRHATQASKKQVKWFNVPPCWIWHTANAYEEGDEVTLVACKATHTRLVDLQTMMGKESTESGYLHMWVFNMKTGLVTEQPLDPELAGEFPVINPRYLGAKNRYVYWATFPAAMKRYEGFDSVAKFDLLTRKRVGVIKYGDSKRGGEAVFCARENAKSEDDGYLMTFVFDEANTVTELWIIDAQEFDEKSVTRLRLPYRVPMGFHGKWLSRAEIETSRK